jgi:phosphoglycerate kinase
MILDVGPAAVEALGDAIKTAAPWSGTGPLGAFETPARSTRPPSRSRRLARR